MFFVVFGCVYSCICYKNKEQCLHQTKPAPAPIVRLQTLTPTINSSTVYDATTNNYTSAGTSKDANNNNNTATSTTGYDEPPPPYDLSLAYPAATTYPLAPFPIEYELPPSHEAPYPPKYEPTPSHEVTTYQ